MDMLRALQHGHVIVIVMAALALQNCPCLIAPDLKLQMRLYFFVCCYAICVPTVPVSPPGICLQE